ncbi:hypothetical protein ZIOFF_004168 [Zingiber officinale]|uniref:Tryptophan synthase beta chain-like PALP domain-containing protein n=1 Tax=Zingiber officinale TaxID=94328 RepID=A0A8J5I7P1_ZINOF|nr:hypothetical protein ZIOFF_004168 [Zingiber officinale]
MEAYQPLASVKDHGALRLFVPDKSSFFKLFPHCLYALPRMIEDVEEKGLLTPGVSTLLAATGGNLGIGLAYIAIRKGYKFIAVMPTEYSLEILLRYLGAKVSPTDSKLGFQGMNDRVNKLKESIPDVYEIDQVTNLANPEAHFRGTGMTFWTIVTCTRLV